MVESVDSTSASDRLGIAALDERGLSSTSEQEGSSVVLGRQRARNDSRDRVESVRDSVCVLTILFIQERSCRRVPDPELAESNEEVRRQIHTSDCCDCSSE